MKRYIDPFRIPESDCPLIVLSTHAYNPLSTGIKIVQKSVYSHAMFLLEPRMLATQEWTFKRKPLVDQMVHGGKMKFFDLDVQPEEKLALRYEILKELNKPWYKTRYDLPGCLMQAIPPLKFINIPWLNFCSESNRKILVRSLGRYSPIQEIPKHPSPRDLNVYMGKTRLFTYYGHWLSD